MKWILAAIAAVVLLGAITWRQLNSEVFSPQMLARLKPGLTTNEVIALVGKPSQIMPAGHWVYDGLSIRSVGIITFDSEGRLSAAFND
jgi:hypothetical protein